MLSRRNEMNGMRALGQTGTTHAKCNGMRERTPSSGLAFLITLIAVLVAAKFIFTTLFTRFAY